MYDIRSRVVPVFLWLWFALTYKPLGVFLVFSRTVVCPDETILEVSKVNAPQTLDPVLKRNASLHSS